MRPESTRVIDLVQFADASSIDPMYVDRTYYLAPDGGVASDAFAVMREIPYDAKGSVYDRCLARPMRFGVASNSIDESFQPADVFAKTKMFRASWLDLVFGGWLMLQTWTANRRSREEYAGMNAAAAWASRANEIAAKTWRATFGPAVLRRSSPAKMPARAETIAGTVERIPSGSPGPGE